ncbi:twin-arginine translocase subunit TatC [Cohnella abietis]|uniref:Sec-independent protein translocase protein TatC n=1 Tax=Cohnella abietis TaxID=2507935 RepID=A0A3T1DF91_9BACL|nr:twin-arginine translocase subunit TatC [Cohnella abietis]BBI36545.1 Sec-independent protein translocase protein TatCy [Cohnella abietis]
MPDMTLVAHLTELRKRVIRISVVLVVAIAGGLSLAVPVISYLKGVPPAVGLEWHALSPWDGIQVYMQFALLFALAVTCPYVLYQLWQFTKPGLTETEQRATLKFIPLSVALMALGSCFAYFLVFPLSTAFLTGLNERMGLQETYGVLQYFSFMFNIVIPCTLLFQMPVVIAFLTAIGIVTPELLRKWRRYCYLLMVILSTMVAPPDLISNLLVLAPLLILFEVSVLLSSAMQKRYYRPIGGKAHESFQGK